MSVEVSVQIKPTWLETPQPETLNQTALWTTPSAIATSISSDTWQTWFSSWMQQIVPTDLLHPAYELTLRLTDDAEIQTLNATYRQQHCPTDVLAFAALEAAIPTPSQGEQHPLELGDIVISVETALAQAETNQHTPQKELAWLACHGLLHLLGWDHPDQVSLEQMLAQQRQMLAMITPSKLAPEVIEN